MNDKLSSARHRLDIDIERMKSANPLEKLDKGYVLAQAPTGKPLKTVKDVSVGDEVKLHLRDGSINAKVISCDTAGEV